MMTMLTSTHDTGAPQTGPGGRPGFVAINFIQCQPHYRERFEDLFRSRARAIDRMPGFIRMQVLRPQHEGESYLVISHWADEASFKAWTQSPKFLEGHRRGFEDLRQAKERGDTPPLTSSFKTYHVITE
jgi:heme-degrading monooxygenase HmoA